MSEKNNSQLVYDTMDISEALNKYLMNHGEENLEALLSGYIKKNLPKIVDKHGLYGVAAVFSPETIDKKDLEDMFKQKDIKESPDVKESNDTEKTGTSRFAESGMYEKNALPKVEADALTHTAPIDLEEGEANNLVEGVKKNNVEEISLPEQFLKTDTHEEDVPLPEISNNLWSDAQTVSPGETFKTRVLQ